MIILMKKNTNYTKPLISFRTQLSISILGIIFSQHNYAQETQQNVSALPIIAISALHETPVAYRSGNMDIPRTEDDVQAYTIIKKEELERSGTTTVTEAITKLLPCLLYTSRCV